jgi:hypothetical protein
MYGNYVSYFFITTTQITQILVKILVIVKKRIIIMQKVLLLDLLHRIFKF